jgi:hypothetical protein
MQKGHEGRQYLKALELEEINDQAVYDQIEHLVLDAIMLNGPVVEIDRELAQTMLLLLKNGIKRSRGGQRNTRQQEISKRTLIAIGRQIKANLIAGRMDATQAHLQAADEATAEGERHGLHVAPGYLHRAMQNAVR